MVRTPLGSNQQKYPQHYDENLSLQIPVRITRREDLPVKSFNDAPRSSNPNLIQAIPKAHGIQNPKRFSSIKRGKCFRLLSLNARSLRNKSFTFVDYVCDVKPELVAVTETWFNDKDTAAGIDCSPPGYRLLDCHRTDSRGGGTALFYQENIPVEKVSAAILNSFEYSEWKICPVGSMTFKLIIIYRPPYSSTHPVSMGTFFNELIEYLESVILCPHPVLITGDFNVHVDNPSNDDALKFLDLLESLGLEQHVQEATHTHGHTLDLVITRIGDHIIQETPKPDFCISDHISIISKILLPKPSLIKKTIQYRKIKNVSISKLKNDIRSSDLLLNTHTNINEFAECFNTTLSRLLEAHAPLITKTITTRPCVPWFSDEIREIKRQRRKAEKLWRRTNKDSDLMHFKSIKNQANYLMKRAKGDFYTNLVNENSHNQKKLYAVAKKSIDSQKRSLLSRLS